MEVRGPDGKVTRFPDGTPDAKVNEVMATIYSAPTPTRAKTDTSASRALVLGEQKPGDNLLSGAYQLARNVSAVAAIQDYVKSKGFESPQDIRTRRDTERGNNTRTGYQAAGNIAGTAPLAYLPGGVLVQGAAGGALLSDANNATDLAKDTAIGAIASRAGQGIVNGASRVISPRVAPVIARLQAEGITPTLGQIARASETYLGRLASKVEDLATSLPILGPAIEGARTRGVQQLNRAAINRVLEPIGQAIPEDVTGNEAVAFAGDRVRDAYQAVLPRINVAVDRGFLQRITAIGQRANLPVEQQNRLAELMRTDVAQAFRGQGGTANGARYKALDEKLGDFASASGRSDNPDVRSLARVVGDVRTQIQALARRQNPGAADELRAVDRAYATLVRVENAAKNTADGTFTPAQLRTAVRQSDRSGRKRSTARGEALLQDLATDASAVLPSRVANSGTLDRGALAAVIGGGAGVAGGLPGMAAAGAGLGVAALPYTRAGQRVAQSVFTGRQGPVPQYLSRLTQRAAAPVSLAAPALLRRPSE